MRHPFAAYLVTISAGNGAGTKSYAGEGLVGLSWAFLRAGAHNVIAGLWEVSNASTPQLMDELYKGLHAGEDPATALRNAKLTLLHSNGNYRKPFYWAPFLLYSGSRTTFPVAAPNRNPLDFARFSVTILILCAVYFVFVLTPLTPFTLAAQFTLKERELSPFFSV